MGILNLYLKILTKDGFVSELKRIKIEQKTENRSYPPKNGEYGGLARALCFGNKNG